MLAIELLDSEIIVQIDMADGLDGQYFNPSGIEVK